MKGDVLDEGNLQDITQWQPDRISRAVSHLYHKKFIALEGDTQFFKGFLITGLLPDGTETIETPDKFKRHFNHTIDLKFYKYSWGATEK